MNWLGRIPSKVSWTSCRTTGGNMCVCVCTIYIYIYIYIYMATEYVNCSAGVLSNSIKVSKMSTRTILVRVVWQIIYIYIYIYI